MNTALLIRFNVSSQRRLINSLIYSVVTHRSTVTNTRRFLSSSFTQLQSSEDGNNEEDFEKHILDKLNKGEIIDGGRADIPTPGSSSGDTEFDESVRSWRLANTTEDPSIEKVFKKQVDKVFKGNAAAQVLNAANKMMDDDDDEDVNIEVALDDDERNQFVNEYNPITGEHNGPTGPEPTRYGDWERSGRVSDF